MKNNTMAYHFSVSSILAVLGLA